MQKSYICLYLEHVSDLRNCTEEAKKNGYDAVATPVVNPLFYREFDYEPQKSKHIAFSRSDLILDSNTWLEKIIFVLNDSIDCDSDDYHIRRHSEQTLKQEMSFAEHVLSQGYVMVKLKSSKCVNLAACISRYIKATVVINVPMVDPKTLSQMWRKDRTEDELNSVGEDTWDWWNSFRLASDFHPKIKIALEFSDDIPSNDVLQRWLGEPVEYIVLPSNIFKKNKKNFPVLSKGHQDILSHFIRNNVHFIIKTNLENTNLQDYAEYIKHFIEKTRIIDPMNGYDDVIQIPLQPLYDNLDSYTYEVFEKDPVKYKFYQQAIEMALIDKVSESKIKEKTIVIMILGAGRGPLVKAALNASENTKRKIKIYIVEKNPNAIVTLVALVEELWSDKDIQIFSEDMRDFVPPEKADILVSELLGSFGDNELSPECLDGAQKHLKKDGISIPCKSTSYINPIMSSKMYNSIRQYCPDRFSNNEKTHYAANQSEMSYVVYFKNIYHISKPKTLFEFNHPNKCKIIDNTRYKKLQFEVEKNCILHGLAGYFDSVLYKDIMISIRPETHSQGLFSWFSMYFPISEPLQLKAGDIIEVNFWRCTSAHKVWYEWNISSPHVSRIHNQGGKNCAMLK